MLDAIFNGLSGLIGYSRGLTNISNNVANLNTPGYKARQLLFSDLFYSVDPAVSGTTTTPFSQGRGVEVGSERMDFTQGDFRTTGNDLDVAIDGNGFFIFRRDGEEFYSRSGQFEFDDEGYLVARGSSDRVQFFEGRRLVDFNADENGLRTNPPKATTEVKFEGSFNVDPNTQPTPPFSAVATIFDAAGTSHTLTLTFTRSGTSAPPIWDVVVKENNIEVGTKTLQWNGDGTPNGALEVFDLDYDPPGELGPVSLRFDFSATRGNSASTSSIAMSSQNGLAAGALTRASFTDTGKIVFVYSNGQTVDGPQLALASFGNVSELEPVGDSAFANRSGQERVLGLAGESMFGRLQGGGIEASNVDLAAQFSELIITQRGYQASSQIITAANEMIQQLLDMRGRR
jgi:flagellar hook protein FlgE